MTIARPLALTAGQNEQVRAAAALLRIADRATFVGVVRRSLARLGRPPSNADVTRAIESAMVVPVVTLSRCSTAQQTNNRTDRSKQ